MRNKDCVQRTDNELAGFHFHGSKFGNQWLRHTVLLVLPVQSVSKFHVAGFFLNKGAHLFLSRRSSTLVIKFAILTRCWLARRDGFSYVTFLVAALENMCPRSDFTAG